MDDIGCLRREQIDIVLQKKKFNEVYDWFNHHFTTASHAEYSTKSPFVIIQGPTGCGKTSTLKYIANELGITVKEYNETTDMTAINYELSKQKFGDESAISEEKSLRLIEQRKAKRFEEFVNHAMMYNINYPVTNHAIADMPVEDDEFDSDDDFPAPPSLPKQSQHLAAGKPNGRPSSLIIHVESSLNFSRSQRVLVQTICKLIKVFKDLSRRQSRRIAVVFETLDCDGETIAIPNKVKSAMGIQTIKFNRITQANMKKLVKSLLSGAFLDENAVESIVNDCDGDIRACINKIHLLREPKRIHPDNADNNSLNRYYRNGKHNQLSPISLPVNKRQKLNHSNSRKIDLTTSLMRDQSRGFGFFHILGKIFYQKRLYPIAKQPPHRAIERPFPTENSTECITDMLHLGPKELKTWIHQHYHKFCNDSSIEKASLFLENLATIDTISIESTQSSQFYETSKTLDPIQTHTTIEATVYSLYHNQSETVKTSHKKVQTSEGPRWIKTSVENASHGELFSFNKPTSMSIANLIEDNRKLLDQCTSSLAENIPARLDSSKILLDYIPYVNYMAGGRTQPARCEDLYCKPLLIQRLKIDDKQAPSGPWMDPALTKMVELLGSIEKDDKIDYDTRHEKSIALIDELIPNFSNIRTNQDEVRYST